MGRFVIGMLLAAVAFGPVVVGGRRLRRALLPGWVGAPAVLADVCLFVAILVGLTQLLALLGLYALLPATAAFALVGIGLARLAPRVGPVTAEFVPAAPSLLGPAGRLLTVGAIALVAGPWAVRVARGWTDGIAGADTLWYHLPGAARLTQTGSMHGIQHFDPGNLTAFYPKNSIFFHSTGMLWLESDVLTPLVNVGWVALALLAGWVIGRPFGIAPATLAGVAVVMGAPGFVGHEAGGAMNDVAGIALLLAASALLMSASPDRLTSSLPAIGLAAAMVGIALGTKWTMVPACGALTAAVIVAAGRSRWIPVAATWLPISGALGLFTYVRNWVLVGNPAPPLDLSLGPVTFERVTDDNDSFAAVAEFLFDGEVWEQQYRPGLETFFGPLWWFVPVAGTVALVVALITARTAMMRLLAAVGAVALAGYLFQPQALIWFDVPAFFLSNLRYGTIGLVFGMVLAPLLPGLRTGWGRWVAPVLFATLLVVTQFDDGLWHGVDDWRFQDPVRALHTRLGIVAAGGVALLGLLVVAGRDRRPALDARLALAGLAAVAGIGLVGIEAFYADERYADEPFAGAYLDETDARVGFEGFNIQYLFYGDDLSNHVEWIGVVEDSRFRVVTECREWVGIVNDAAFSHLVFGSPVLGHELDSYAVARRDPAAVLERDFAEGAGAESLGRTAVFRVEGPLDPARCDA